MTLPQAQQPGPRPLPTATFTASRPDFGDPADDDPLPNDTGGGGGPPDDDGPVLMHDDLRQLAWDVLAARNGLCALDQLLRGTEGPERGIVSGLVVLLEGPRCRLDVAVEALASIASEFHVDGIPLSGAYINT